MQKSLRAGRRAGGRVGEISVGTLLKHVFPLRGVTDAGLSGNEYIFLLYSLSSDGIDERFDLIIGQAAKRQSGFTGIVLRSDIDVYLAI